MSVLSVPPDVSVQANPSPTPIGIRGKPMIVIPLISNPPPWSPISWLICGAE